MKDHYLGATYEMTQDNMNYLIKQLDEARAQIAKLTKAVEYIKLCHLTPLIRKDLERILE